MEVQTFLACETPKVWLEYALKHLDILLIDHAHCEKKAASTALSLIFRYPKNAVMLHWLSRLAREELRHFERVLAILKRRNIAFDHLKPSHYAQGLSTLIRTYEPERMADTFIMGAFIEARSCERFEKLVPHLDEELAKFYRSLLASEARHFQHYLALAKTAMGAELIEERIELFRQKEAELILSPDSQFRFHSGVPNFSGDICDK